MRRVPGPGTARGGSGEHPRGRCVHPALQRPGTPSVPTADPFGEPQQAPSQQTPEAPCGTIRAQLGTWVDNQRRRAAALTPEQMEQLSKVGMRWA
ncbi:helicase associated domain-containing protein [Streptomyces subrutilus]|uniref:helicase associated domain-containing protein n=1 Tax=Streptomyces subrutilus TaxID=36818 RepID=UPI003405119A